MAIRSCQIHGKPLPVGPSLVVCPMPGFQGLLCILPLQYPIHLRLCISHEGKDLSVHPPPQPMWTRMSNPTTWSHAHPSKIRSIAYEYVYAVMVHQTQNIQELLHALQYQKRPRGKQV